MEVEESGLCLSLQSRETGEGSHACPSHAHTHAHVHGRARARAHAHKDADEDGASDGLGEEVGEHDDAGDMLRMDIKFKQKKIYTEKTESFCPTTSRGADCLGEITDRH